MANKTGTFNEILLFIVVFVKCECVSRRNLHNTDVTLYVNSSISSTSQINFKLQKQMILKTLQLTNSQTKRKYFKFTFRVKFAS